jgi:polar amino acid transport system substrate-binding protein
MTMTSRTKFRSPLPALLASMLLGATLETAQAQQPPAPGTSPRIDAIKKAGALRIAVLSNPPWLVENTTSSGDAWSGPAWLLANEYARLLGVKVQLVPVSHETKVPVLASNQADMTISPLSVTPERLKVVDFVTYSATALCVFGRADNPKVASAKSVDEFNRPDVTIAYFTGGGEENWVKKRFPNAKLRGVSAAGTAAPVEEILAKRADVSPINRVPWMALSRKVKGLQALPQGNNCQDSTEMATPIGLAIDKSQPEYLNWLKAVAESMNAKLKADEARLINTM